MTKQERYPIKKISFIILGFEALFWLLLLVAIRLLNTIGSVSTTTKFDFAQPSNLLLTGVLLPFYWLFLRKLNRKNNFFASIPHSIQSIISPQKSIRAVLRELFLFRTRTRIDPIRANQSQSTLFPRNSWLAGRCAVHILALLFCLS